MSKITVVGSSNMDITVRTPHIPAKGETVFGGDVRFISKVGQDANGRLMLDHFVEEGICTAGVIFNASNILLSASTSIAGLAVAFPLGVGISLVLGTVINYIGAPKGDPVTLFVGVALIVVAIICNGIASGKLQKDKKDGASKGVYGLLGVMFLFFVAGLGFIIVSGN